MKILGKRVLIEPVNATISAGGIVLPQASSPDRLDQEGIVMAIGSGIKEALPYTKGSHVFVEIYKADFRTEFQANGKSCRLVDWTAIVGVMGATGFRPVGDRILLKPIPTVAPDSKIIRPSAYEEDEDSLITCTVHLLGNGVRNKKGEYRPFSVKVGDTVMVKAFAGRDVDCSDGTYKLVKETDIQAVIGNEEVNQYNDWLLKTAI